MSLYKRILNACHAAWTAVCATANHLQSEYIVEQYLRAGAHFGDVLALTYQGDCANLEGARRGWAKLERQYALLGYRTVSVEDFIEYGGYGKSVDHLLRVKLQPGEAPVYHADEFEKKLAEGLTPLVEFGGDGRPRCSFRPRTDVQPQHQHDCGCGKGGK